MLKLSNPERILLTEVQRFAKARHAKLYLVGGFLRDLILGRQKENPDFDFCLKKQAITLGKKLAKKMRAGFVVLDKEHGACRIVRKIGARAYTFDFTDFRKPRLEKDLLHRDFTINAIALSLEDALKARDLNTSLIDPFCGRKDLKDKVIRAVSSRSFLEDPLRILRAFSFASLLGFKIEEQSLKQAAAGRKRLSKVSAERIREELFKVFESRNTFTCLMELDRLKILEVIFPEIKKMRGIGQGPYHHLDVWQHTLETVRQFELLLDEIKQEEIRSYLNQEISAQRKRYQLLKLAALLHDIGKPASMRREGKKIIFHGHEIIGTRMTKDVALWLKLSNDELNALEKIVRCHLRPGYLADSGQPTARAIFRFFRDAAQETVSVLLLSLADQRATKGPLTTRASRKRHEKIVFLLLKEYFRRKKETKKPRLLNGDELIREFKLKPSPLIGKILSEVEELQAIGRLQSKAQALKVAQKIISKEHKG